MTLSQKMRMGRNLRQLRVISGLSQFVDTVSRGIRIEAAFYLTFASYQWRYIPCSRGNAAFELSGPGLEWKLYHATEKVFPRPNLDLPQHKLG